MKWKKQLIRIVGIVALFWIFMTVLAEKTGKQQIVHSAPNGAKKALIVYNPDPFYNLDYQVCQAFAEGLQAYGITTKIVTNKKLGASHEYDLYVFCANTYNFAPDRGIRKAIKNLDHLEGKKAVAIVVGSGSTKRAQKRFNQFLKKQKLEVIGSETFWLMRPNEEPLTGKNTDIAATKAKQWVKEIVKEL